LAYCAICAAAMKTLYLVRHAKSSWDDSDLSDFERPLNERGKRDAPMMAERLKGNNILPEHFISSPAKRAASTSKHFAKVLGISEDEIQHDKKLYHASPADILYVVKNISDKYRSAILFGHNPGLTDVINNLIEGNFLTDNVPTCGIAALSFDVKSWKDIITTKGKLLFYDYPKKPD
jgi:phosphohistidine phosphatase